MPSPIEKLQKFFKLEAERGYDNRAVVGGLDKIVPAWDTEAQTLNYPESLIEMVRTRLLNYPNLESEERSQSLADLLTLLKEFQSEHPQLAASQAQPAAPRKPIPPARPKPARSADSGSADDLAPAPPPAADLRQRPTRPVPPKAEPIQGLDAPLTVISGIGTRYAQSLRSLGLETLNDLLYFFPRRYDDYSQFKPINRLEYGDELTVLGTIQSIVVRPIRGGQSQLTEAVITDGTGFLRVTWFNSPYIANKLKSGDQIVLSGKVDMYLGRKVMNNPDWESLEQEHLHTNRIVPVYPLTAQVTQKNLRRILHQTVTFWASRLTDHLPASVRTETHLPDLSTAIRNAHFPDSMDSLTAARRRLAFDEIFLLQLGVQRQKQSWQSLTAQVFEPPAGWLDEQIQRLPYELTNAQRKALAELESDLRSGRPMNRLLQGDVGSGKTVVAALAAAVVLQAGAQVAFMAPTSILAEQHYRSLTRLLSAEDGSNLLRPAEIALLVGDTSEAEKAAIRSGLAEGSIRLVIGTHALIEGPITFQRLQMAVIDEQHRFGVAQRAALRNKGENPHLLVMTATPIPRSLALTLYGDLDLAVMDEMPVGRLPIETHVLHPLERERAYHLLRTQIDQGRQAFIIYPLVEKGEREDDSKAAVEEHQRLQREVFPHLKLGLLHGRMRPDEKEQVMGRFRDGEYHILVSTSVVEVGVDVPNATVMLIEGANRFGLAQLHQFRGRVGRGQDQSYCLLIPESENAVENERLVAMEQSSDGFVLAERDLEQRGPGDFLGSRQSGFMELKMASLTDVRLIEIAREQAQKLFAMDPELQLPEHANLSRVFDRFWAATKGELS